MADEKQIREVVARVTAELANESQGYERELFKVGDLKAHLSDFRTFGGGDAAWTISYKTAAITSVEGVDLVGPGGDAAWTISYKTSAAGDVVEEQVAKRTAKA
jgi:hypothetical protein